MLKKMLVLLLVVLVLGGCATIKKFDYYDPDSDGPWGGKNHNEWTWERCRDMGQGSYGVPLCKKYGW